MNAQKRKIIVTSALPYANGEIHLGHLVEYIQTDIWVRFQRLIGSECYYICGNDAHGTAIMLNAEKRGISPAELIAIAKCDQLNDFTKFAINFSHFSSTDSSANKIFSEQIYTALQTRGDITRKVIKQLYDPEKGIFLPDRFIKGACPKCSAQDQYGDACESCGSTYSPTELKNPRSVVSGATPVLKDSEHYFFELAHYTQALQDWLQTSNLQDEVRNKLQEWFDDGLQAWDISRDAPYFGFLIPGTTDKYFYVWFDAPIGYISAFKEFCDQEKLDFEEFWQENSTTELYHFIGKDVAYFHTLFWPAMLMGSNYRLPTSVYVHGMLTVNGQKMSKSRGTFIKAKTYAEYLNPECLRYYYAAKLSNQIVDIDLNLEDFRLRVNSDLVGKVINIASRCAGFIHKKFDAKLSARCFDEVLFQYAINAGNTIAEHYEQREFSKAIRDIMALADHVNQFIDTQQPWVTAKNPELEQQTHEVCSLGLNLFKIIMTYLKPVIPVITQMSEQFMAIEFAWDNRKDYLANHTINTFTPLLQRIEQDKIDAMLHASIDDLTKTV